ncbi:MAG: tetratricopeptide repeat protein [Bacteroidetes bacterium]|nr:tetratricopeptide repeat protein [Bacteroidota bacterium]
MRPYNLITIVIIGLLFLATSVFAQSPIDSLKIELVHAREDTAKAKICDLLAFYYQRISPDSGLLYARKTLEYARRAGWIKGQALGYMELSLNYRILSENLAAIHAGDSALKLLEKANEPTVESAILCAQAQNYQAIGNISESSQNYLRAYSIEKQFGTARNAAIILENLGNLFFELKDYEKADSLYAQSMITYRRIQDSAGIASSYGNRARIESAKGNFTGAIAMQKRALEINNRIRNRYSAQINLANIGLAFHEKKDYEEALSYLDSSLRICQAIGNHYNEVINFGNIGAVWHSWSTDPNRRLRKRQARAYRDSSIKYLRLACNELSRNNSRLPFMEFSKILSELLIESGMMKEAVNLMEQRMEAVEALTSEKIELGRERYESQQMMEEKDRALNISKLELAIQRRNEILILLSAMCLLLTAVFCLIYLRKKNEMQKKQLHTISQTHSHQIRGPLCRLIGLSELVNNPKLSKEEKELALKGIDDSAKELDYAITSIIFHSSNS